jgi:hypothetical protein
MYALEVIVSVMSLVLHSEDADSYAFLADMHCKLSSSMSSGAGRAAARETKQADPKKRRVRDILAVRVIDAVVIAEE